MTHYDHGNNWKVRGHLQAAMQAQNEGDAVLLGADGKIPGEFVSGSGFRYGLAFNPTTFKTDPTGCLTYTLECANHTPVSNLNNVLSTGSWKKEDPMLAECFYATISEDGDILHVLNPNNLAQDINGADVSAEITTENVMFCIPTRYISRNASGIVHSSRPSDGIPYAHRRGGHTYKYCAIGVYPGVIVNDNGTNKLKSVSGQTPSNNTTGQNFITYAKNNDTDLEWHVWNYHEWALMRDMELFMLKSFDGQRRLGNGASTGGSSGSPGFPTNGALNASGMFAGNVNGTTSPVKCLIEQPWATIWQLVSDCQTATYRAKTGTEPFAYYQDFYVGDNDNAHVDEQTTSKDLVCSIPCLDTALSSAKSAWVDTIQYGDVAWGMPDSLTGGDAIGTCDIHWMNGNVVGALRVGGSSNDGSDCGLSAMSLDNALSTSLWIYGARLAFSFD